MSTDRLPLALRQRARELRLDRRALDTMLSAVEVGQDFDAEQLMIYGLELVRMAGRLGGMPALATMAEMVLEDAAAGEPLAAGAAA